MPNEFVIRNGFISKGNSIVEGGLTATTISASTYSNLPSPSITVGTSQLTSGTDTRVLFQSGTTLQQDGNFTFDPTLKRLTLQSVGSTSSDIPFVIRSSGGTFNIVDVVGTGDINFRTSNVGATGIINMSKDVNGAPTMYLGSTGYKWHNFYTSYIYSPLDGNNGYEGRIDLGRYNGAVRTRFVCAGDSFLQYSNLVLGATTAGARLDVRAQGALSTDIAFRVRNSADTRNAFEILGDEITKVRADGNVSSALPLQIESSTGGFSTWLGLSIAQTVRSGYFALQSQGLQDNYNHVRFISGRSAGASQISAYITQTTTDRQGHWQFRTQVHLGDAVRLYNNAYGLQTFVVETGTAPSATPTDGFVQYSADITAGNAAPHFRTENGSIVKLYQNANTVAIDDNLINLGVRASGGTSTFTNPVSVGSFSATTGTINGNLTITGDTTMPNRSAFSVYGAGTTNNLTTTQNGDGTLNTNNFGLTYSQGTGFDISTGIFTAPIAGLYQVTLIGRNAGFAGGISQLAVIRNNSNASGNVMMIEWAASSSMNHTGGGQIFRLAVGDTLRLKVLAGQINFDGNDNWSVAYIG